VLQCNYIVLHYIVLQCTMLCCSVIHCVAVEYFVLHYVVLQYIAMNWRVLQSDCYSVLLMLHYVAVCCSESQQCEAVCGRSLYHAEYILLQCTAVVHIYISVCTYSVAVCCTCTYIYMCVYKSVNICVNVYVLLHTSLSSRITFLYRL